MSVCYIRSVRLHYDLAMSLLLEAGEENQVELIRKEVSVAVSGFWCSNSTSPGLRTASMMM